MLEIRNIEKYYGDRKILNNISWSFQSSNIYGIIGPNGAGKSTLLRILGGFEKPHSGQIILNGDHLSNTSPLIACMWQKPYLFSTTVFNNIAYGLKVRGVSQELIKVRTNELLGKFKLEHLAQSWATQLSGGEGARVALARSLACSSPIIILDEPAANLDPLNTRLMEETLLEIQRDEGLTIIIVTHDMFQAKRIADYTLFLDEGIIKEAKRTEELFHNPENPSTQYFLKGII